MALYTRGRIWYADFYNGKSRVQVSTGTANRREAEKFLALRISEVERGEYRDCASTCTTDGSKCEKDCQSAKKMVCSCKMIEFGCVMKCLFG